MSPVQSTRLRHYALEGMCALAYWTMICSRWPRRGGATVLMYHSVASADLQRFVAPALRLTPAMFERQMAFVARRCRVVSLSALIDCLACGRAPAPATVAITFDDGYLDTLHVAAPILARYQLPATLFVPTAHITDAEPQWADSLHTAMTFRTRHRLTLREMSANLSDPQQRSAVRHTLGVWLRTARYQERRQILEDVERQLRPSETLPRLILRWEEVNDLVRRFPLFEIGGHSVHHSDLSACDPGALQDEIYGCIADLRREIGPSPKHFSFPYGRSSPAAQEIVAAAGFQSACAIGSLLTDQRSNRFAIGRLDPRISMSQFKFRSSSLPKRRAW